MDSLTLARKVADAIMAAGYRNMGVTYSPDGEYTSSVDILVPIPDEEPDTSKRE